MLDNASENNRQQKGPYNGIKHNHITCVYIIKAICLSGDSCNNTTSYILSLSLTLR